MRVSLIAAVIAGLAVSVMAADHIASQRREGSKIIVVYDSGRVSTNALFLAMSPDVRREMERRRAEAAMLAALRAVVADTRTNIAETAGMSDLDIAALYLRQMPKSADPLAASVPTNTIERLIGAGMRQDLQGLDK